MKIVLMSRIALALILCMGTTAAHAQLEAHVHSSASHVQPDEVFTLWVEWSGTSDLGSAEYFMFFNTDQLTLVNRQFNDQITFAQTDPPGPLNHEHGLIAINQQIHQAASTYGDPARADIWIDWFRPDGHVGMDVELEFKATGTSIGQRIEVDLDLWELLDVNAQPLAGTVHGRSITVVPEPGSLAVMGGLGVLLLLRPQGSDQARCRR